MYDGDPSSFATTVPVEYDTADDSLYDFALMICNGNGAKDDNFQLSINGALLGLTPNLNFNTVGANWWMSTPEVQLALQSAPFMNWAACSDADHNGLRPLYPLAGSCTTGVGPQFTWTNIGGHAAFAAPNFVVDGFNVFNNRNGNFGDLMIVRFHNLVASWEAFQLSFEEDVNPYDPENRVCIVGWVTHYSAFSGQNFSINFATQFGGNPQVLV